MSVKLIGNTRHYVGLAGDTKPVTTTTETVPPGSTFQETDTGREFKWDGYRWAIETESRVADLLEKVLDEIRRMNARDEKILELHMSVAAEL